MARKASDADTERPGKMRRGHGRQRAVKGAVVGGRRNGARSLAT